VPTANTDNSFSTLGLSHALHDTSVVEEETIFSKVVPQSRHLNSKSGIGFSSWEYSQPPPALQSPLRKSGWRHAGDFTVGAFYVAFSAAPPLKSLDSQLVIDYIEARYSWRGFNPTNTQRRGAANGEGHD
jgi:hypothetical protein